MSSSNWLSTLLLCSSLLWITGCVGPMACGPTGHHGPVAFGTSCDGCGDCDGCGELYIDPWINHPPDACDPCDQCGNYNGQSCGKCRSVFDGFATLWGYRCDPVCGGCNVAGCDGGCGVDVIGDGCCGDGCSGCDSCYAGNSQMVEITMEPTPAKEIVEATPSEVPYMPHRTRKIFRPRPNVATAPAEAEDF